MPRPKAPRWTPAEIAILRGHYPPGGLAAVAPLLADRSLYSIKVKVARLGIRTMARNSRAPVLRGGNLEEAIRLRAEGVSFLAIGARLGCSEAGATNAIKRALAERSAQRPAQRDRYGRLLPAEIERLRVLLKRGVKPCDIQRATGISASRISHERSRYDAELRAHGKAPLPPPGNGERYCGASLPRDAVRQVEQLFLEGYGSQKVAEKAGIGKTTAIRLRAKLVRRLRRSGESLPGCDASGKRLTFRESSRFILPEQKEQLRGLLMDRVPVSRAARIVGMGECSAYRLRDQWRVEGTEFPPPILPGKRKLPRSAWLPPGQRWACFHRALAAKHGGDEAKRIIVEGIAALGALPGAVRRYAARQPLTFEQQLEKVRGGAAIVTRIESHRATPAGTLGGVSSRACAEAA